MDGHTVVIMGGLNEVISTWPAVLLDELRDEDGGQWSGAAGGAAVLLGQQFPGLEGSDGAFAGILAGERSTCLCRRAPDRAATQVVNKQRVDGD
jgi:hypothetical protein